MQGISKQEEAQALHPAVHVWIQARAVQIVRREGMVRRNAQGISLRQEVQGQEAARLREVHEKVLQREEAPALGSETGLQPPEQVSEDHLQNDAQRPRMPL